MAGSLTFAEAYYRQLKAAEGRPKRQQSSKAISSVEDLNQALTKIVEMLEDPKLTVRDVRITLTRVNSSAMHLVTKWVDRYKLDMVHHAIIFGRCDILTYLLSNDVYFPQTHVPSTNPYAHLAAFLGQLDCLRAIMQYRPGDYFKITKPSQTVKLPFEVMKSARISERPRPVVNKKLNKLLGKIKAIPEDVEKLAQSQTLSGGDVTEILDKEFESLDLSSTKKRSALPVLRTLRGIATELYEEESKAASLSREIRSSSTRRRDRGMFRWGKCGKQSTTKQEKKNVKGSPRKSKAEVSPQKMEKEDEVIPHLKPDMRAGRGQHLLTVYWDVLSDMAQGVVKGAGKPVSVKFVKEASMPRPHINLDVPTTLSRQARHNTPLRIFSKPTGSSAKPALDIPSSKSTEPSAKPALDIPSSKFTRPSAKSTLDILGQSSTLDQKRVSTYPGRDATGASKKKVIEMGVRGKKKYKDFRLQVDSQSNLGISIGDDTQMNKTPLTLAAERGHVGCVQFLLDNVVLKNNPNVVTKEPLTLATKARSPEALMLLLEKSPSRRDFQSAVLLSIREMYPECLSALLSSRGSGDRHSLFDGTNLYHVLYSQSLMANYRYAMMPEMTRVLINCKEDINAKNVPHTFPLYTLLNCAFNINTGKQIFYYIECLEILLAAKANPHFNEKPIDQRIQKGAPLPFSRQAFSSAINCVFESARASVKFFESVYWSNLFMKKFITTIATRDRTTRRILNEVLFDCMESVCELGLDRTILRALLAYGANPDFRNGGKYAVNVFFDKMLQHLTKFEVIGSYATYETYINNLMIVCRNMSNRCLKDAELVFLYEHLLNAPVQALPICRYFGYHLNNLCRSPRPLTDLAAQFIWLFLKRNEKRAKQLPIAQELKSLIIP